jgi:hypothetical protein
MIKMIKLRPPIRTILFAVLGTTSIGCETVVTEYHQRSSFYRMASDVELVDEYVDANGRRVVFIEDGPLPSEQERLDEVASARVKAKKAERDRLRSEAIRAGKPIPPEAMEPKPPKKFLARQVLDDGTIIMQAMFPDHVLANTMSSLRNQQYLELWDQMVAESTKRQYQAQGLDVDDFVRFCVQNRSELMMTLNRMSFSYYGGSEVIIERMQDLSVRLRFSPQIGSQFTFREVFIAQERDGMRLAGIH